MKTFDHDTITITVYDALAIESRTGPWDIVKVIMAFQLKIVIHCLVRNLLHFISNEYQDFYLRSVRA